MSQRTEKVESIVQQTVAIEIVNLMGQDAARITVTSVDVSPDLRHATIWLGILGDSRLQKQLFDRVVGGAGDLQRAVYSKMTTKFVPYLEFKIDTGGEYAAGIDKLLKNS
jgi:ribosome-binding factor A